MSNDEFKEKVSQKVNKILDELNGLDSKTISNILGVVKSETMKNSLYNKQSSDYKDSLYFLEDVIVVGCSN